MTFTNVFNLWLYLVLLVYIVPIVIYYFFEEHNHDFAERFYVILVIILAITSILDMFAIINTIIKLFR